MVSLDNNSAWQNYQCQEFNRLQAEFFTELGQRCQDRLQSNGLVVSSEQVYCYCIDTLAGELREWLNYHDDVLAKKLIFQKLNLLSKEQRFEYLLAEIFRGGTTEGFMRRMLIHFGVELPNSGFFNAGKGMVDSVRGAISKVIGLAAK